MFGHPASWQTVWSFSVFTIEWIAVYSGPILAVVRIHSGLRSMGVSELRASTRSRRRPSGATVMVLQAYARPEGARLEPVPVENREAASGISLA